MAEPTCDACKHADLVMAWCRHTEMCEMFEGKSVSHCRHIPWFEDNGPAPLWCPLRTGPIVVELGVLPSS